MSTFQVYNVTGEEDHPPIARSASKVLVRAINSKVDVTGKASKVFSPFTALRGLGREDVYDPHKYRNMPNPTTYSETMMHLLKACFGAGMLALPNAMSRLGLVFGIIGVGFLGFFSCFCLQLLIISQYEVCKRKKVAYLDFPDSVRLALRDGPPFMHRFAEVSAYTVDFLIILWQLGVCAIYLVFVGENLKQVMVAYGAEINIRLLIICQYPVLVAVCMIKDLKKMAPLSTFSNFCNFIGVVLVFYYLSYEDLQVNNSHYELKSLMDIPVFIGTVLFAIMAPGVLLALERNMATPKDFVGWCGLFSIGTIIIVVVYTAFGVFGYLRYGMACESSITLNLPQNEKKAQAAKTAFAATIYTSYPLQNFVGWQTIWGLVRKKVNDDIKTDMMLRVVVSTVPFGMALAAPTLGPFIGLMGSLCLTIIGILFPAVVHINVAYPNQYGAYKHKLILDFLFIFMGIFCCFSGVYTSILEMKESLRK